VGYLMGAVVRVARVASERVARLLRGTRIERSRAEAEYPLTGNDPTGRITTRGV
jgi:hypothetical protein